MEFALLFKYHFGIRGGLGVEQNPLLGEQVDMCLFYGVLSICISQRWSDANCLTSLKNSCAQMHSTTSELRIVNWEAANVDEELRKVRSQVTGCTSAMFPAPSQHSSFMFRMA